MKLEPVLSTLIFPGNVTDVFTLISLILFAISLALLLYSLRLLAKLTRLLRESLRQQAATRQPIRTTRQDAEARLNEAIDHIDAAIYLLERYVRDVPEKAEKLKEQIYALEDVEETLEKLVRKRKSLT
jgi:septal ring factor EnvC (AmiA/AmiB activator)